MRAVLRTVLHRSIKRMAMTVWALMVCSYLDLMPGTGVMVWNGYHQ